MIKAKENASRQEESKNGGREEKQASDGGTKAEISEVGVRILRGEESETNFRRGEKEKQRDVRTFSERTGKQAQSEKRVGNVTYRYTEVAPEAYSARSQEIQSAFDRLGIVSIVTEGPAQSERNGCIAGCGGEEGRRG